MSEGLRIRQGLLITFVLGLAGCSSDSNGSSPGNDTGGSSSTGGASIGTGGVSNGARPSSGGAGTAAGGAIAGTGGRATGTGGGTAGTGGGGTAPSGTPGTIGACNVFTSDDDWNRDISGEPADTTWTTRLQMVVSTGSHIHPDYGAGYGIPINVVPQGQKPVPVKFVDYADESDPGPYPFPEPGSARIEGGTASSCDGDCHLLVVQSGACVLYEGYACTYTNGWNCSNGAKWDLTKKSYGQRPKGWTSADAAGLPVTPGLVRLDEVRAGAVNHAIRFTLGCTSQNFVAPATHQAGCSKANTNTPPMGFRVRLNKTKFDISKLSASAQVVAKAMQTYGLILADNGSDFYFQGEDNDGWADTDIEPLKTIPTSAFEAITPPALEN
jgi:hypothetical protein